MTRGPPPTTRRVARLDMPDHSPRQPRYGRRVRGFRYDRPRHKRRGYPTSRTERAQGRNHRRRRAFGATSLDSRTHPTL